MQIEILGNPISINRLYRGRRFLTPEGKETKEYYALCIATQWRRKCIQGPVAVRIILHFTDNRRRDIDGPVKALLDAMTGIVFDDDSQVFELTIKKVIGKKAKAEIALNCL